uniref:Uncharacterized protein n=1 Tax=Cannabis sativa TaxID=3483 RepID=A0A803PPS3_CANSA
MVGTRNTIVQPNSQTAQNVNENPIVDALNPLFLADGHVRSRGVSGDYDEEEEEDYDLKNTEDLSEDPEVTHLKKLVLNHEDKMAKGFSHQSKLTARVQINTNLLVATIKYNHLGVGPSIPMNEKGKAIADDP